MLDIVNMEVRIAKKNIYTDRKIKKIYSFWKSVFSLSSLCLENAYESKSEFLNKFDKLKKSVNIY